MNCISDYKGTKMVKSHQEELRGHRDSGQEQRPKALMEIQKYQKSGELLIRKAPFAR